MKTLRNLYLTGAALLLLSLSPSASATLCQNANWMPDGMTIPEIVVDPSAQVGAVLHVLHLYRSAGSNNGPCLSSTVTMTFTGADALVAPNTYNSRIPGVGYRLRITSGGCTSAYFPTSCSGKFGPGVPTHTMEMELVKTGPITSGNRPAGAQIATWRDNYNHPTYTDDFARFTLFQAISVRVRQPPTCSISSAGPIKASLGSFPAKSFKGVGSTSPARPVNIDLKCNGGDPGMSAEAHVTLTDATNTGNRSNVLTLSPDSQAKGVGIEVLKGDTVLAYGPDSNATGNLNQWHAGTISTGMSTFSIPLTARYVQTDPVVTPGSANGRATFTMSYQ